MFHFVKIFKNKGSVIVLLLATIMLLGMPVFAQNAHIQSEENQSERAYSEWEQRIAREVIASGQMLDSDPRFEDVVSLLVQRGQSALPSGAAITQGWVRENLNDILPDIDNKMADAAMKAATNEVVRGVGKASDNLLNDAIHYSSEGSFDAENSLKETALRSGLEGAKAAAAASDLHALRALELEYSLREGGLDEYSVLTVQPIWASEELRHNLFAQGSYANKEIDDLYTENTDHRDTANAGLAYRYITPDLQHMIGANLFYDHQWPYHHSRMSFGLDYKTSLYGLAVNKYIGLSDWRSRHDGYEEKALGGEDIELSGRLEQFPALELFAKGYHWAQEATPAINPKGTDIWGYQVSAEYTPINAFTFRGQASKDNEMNDMQGEIGVRLNYALGQNFRDLWRAPSYDLSSVLERRFDKVRRTNEIRVQVRQDASVTARVTFAQGANVSVGDSLSFGTTITTGNAVGDSVTVVFGDGSRLDVGQNTSVTVENDRIVLSSGLIQFTDADGGISVIVVPGGTIDLIGTDVDVRVSGGTTTLRVRDGAANFTDDKGTTRVDAEELAEAQDGDAVAPQLRADSTAIYETHVTEAHAQLDLVGPAATEDKAAPYAIDEVDIVSTLKIDSDITFTVPLNKAVTVTGAPQLAFTLGAEDRLADYTSGSGTTALVFSYTMVNVDEDLVGVSVSAIEKNGGTLLGANGAPMALTLQGSLSGTVACALTALNIGERCNGVVYAGVSGGNRIYTTETDQARIAWNNGTATRPVTGATSLSDGKANTDILVALSDGGAPYLAAQLCRDLGPEWYLPSRDERNLLCANQAAIGGFGSLGYLWYWSSTEASATNAYSSNFTSCSQNNYTKSYNNTVRCVRRD